MNNLIHLSIFHFNIFLLYTMKGLNMNFNQRCVNIDCNGNSVETAQHFLMSCGKYPNLLNDIQNKEEEKKDSIRYKEKNGIFFDFEIN